MPTDLEHVESSGRDAMLEEARRIVDAARRRDLTLRLIGGLAVREQCRGADLAARRYRDIDLVCLRAEFKQVVSLLTDRGFAENGHYRLASSGQMAQFFRPCVHRDDGRSQHVDDRIDVFVDTFRLDHQIALKERLGFEDYTAPASDVLLVKLQRAAVNEDDLGDIVALLRHLPLIDRDAPGAVNVRYIARLCAHDWGLHHDVTRNLERCRAHLSHLEPDAGARGRVSGALEELQAALRIAPKGLRWRVRSLFGEALPWHDTVDERDGVRIGRLEGV